MEKGEVTVWLGLTAQRLAERGVTATLSEKLGFALLVHLVFSL